VIRKTLTIVLAFAALTGGLGAFGTRQSPPRVKDKLVMVRIPYGILMHDESCSGTTHALLDPCAPHPVEIYIAFPPGQDLKTFEGKNVVLRGSLHDSDCARLVLKASSIGPSTEPFTCEKPGGRNSSEH